MLEKTVGVNHIHTFKVLHIIKANFNLMIGILWDQWLMQHALQHKQLERLNGPNQCWLVTKSDRLALEHHVWCTNAPPTPPNTRMDPSDQQLSTRQSMPTQPSWLTVQHIREYGIALLRAACSNKKYTTTEINTINKCRIYMQAETLSDMCNIQGTALDNQGIYHLHKNPDPFTLWHPTGLWSKQAPPGPKQWKIWNTFVHQEFTTCTKSNTLW